MKKQSVLKSVKSHSKSRKKQNVLKVVSLSLRAPLHPVPSAINLSSVHSKTSIFHSNSNEDMSSTVWEVLGNFGQLRPKIWCPNVALKKYSPIVAPPPLSLPGKCADQLGRSPQPAADVPSKQLATLLKVRQVSTHCPNAQSNSLTEQKSHQGPLSVVNKIYIS